MDYPVKFGEQLKQQLRALRKSRGMNQTRLGLLVGVTQRRIAEIEGNPGVVGVDQIIKILSALGAELVVRDLAPSDAGPREEARPKEAPRAEPKAAHEFRAPLPASARHLVAVVAGNPKHAPEAYLWRTGERDAAYKLTSQDRRRLIDALAREILINPHVLEAHLAEADRADLPPAPADVPTTEIHDQWAKALSVSPEALRHAVLAALKDRQPPPGLRPVASKGSW
jgi:HTH-type transcriptional regulator/antitoxin HipB